MAGFVCGSGRAVARAGAGRTGVGGMVRVPCSRASSCSYAGQVWQVCSVSVATFGFLLSFAFSFDGGCDFV